MVTANSEKNSQEKEISIQNECPVEVQDEKLKSNDMKSSKMPWAASPEREAARQIERETSPVREFLNQDESEEDAPISSENC